MKKFEKRKAQAAFDVIAAGAILLVLVVAGLFIVNAPKPIIDDFSSKPIEKFSSYSDLVAYFEKAGSSDNYYGDYRNMVDIALPVMATGAAQEKAASDSSASATDFSKTNIQVEGVDEADIIKNDGKYIYAIANGKLFIVNAYPAENAKIIATIDVNDLTPTEMFISSDSKELLLFSNKGYSYGGRPYYSKMMVSPGYYPYYGGGGTNVRLYDISDKTSPSLVKEVEFEGSYLNSRLVGDNAYFVINSNPRVYYAQAKYSNGSDENSIIPLMKVNGVEEAIAVPTDIAIMPRVRPESFVTIASLNLKTQTLKKETAVGSAQNLYASTDNIYLVDQVWEYSESEDNNSVIPMEVGMIVKSMYFPNWKTTEKTVINKFHVNDGSVSFAGNSTVPGHILNQFSMDEYKGNFRIATTVENYGSFEMGSNTSPANRSTNNLYVLDSDMNLVGSLEGIAPDETIYSVRFMGEKGYMVTFKYVDPLFVIDLSDPTNPRILGKLKIPGYSDYMQMIDETHILGIGKDANELEDIEKVHSQGAIYYTAIKGIKIAIFDVSDVEHPVEMSKFIIGDRGTDSEALNNHKAILFDKEKELLVLPITIVENKTANTDYYGTEQTFQGAVILNVSLTNGLSEKGKITHVSADEEMKRGYYYDSTSIIRRSLFMDNVLYTFSDKMLKTNELSDLSAISEVAFPGASQSGYYTGGPEIMID
jgi:uncharacterized secreted protein with C-terminal beta-propeller domain